MNWGGLDLGSLGTQLGALGTQLIAQGTEAIEKVKHDVQSFESGEDYSNSSTLPSIRQWEKPTPAASPTGAGALAGDNFPSATEADTSTEEPPSVSAAAAQAGVDRSGAVGGSRTAPAHAAAVSADAASGTPSSKPKKKIIKKIIRKVPAAQAVGATAAAGASASTSAHASQDAGSTAEQRQQQQQQQEPEQQQQQQQQVEVEVVALMSWP